MGASKSKTNSSLTCPRRVKAVAEPAKSEALPISTKIGSQAEIITKEQVKEVKTAAESVKLPTNSWRELLKEAPDNKPGIKQDDAKILNASAKPFFPNQAPAAQAAPAATLKHTQPAVDEPEWMQYLTKKLDAKLTPAPPPKPPPAKTSSGKTFQRSNGEGLSGEPGGGSFRRRDPGEVEDAPSGGNVVIHTESYLKLLKDGASKKKAFGTSAETNRKKLADKSGLALVPTLGRKQGPAVQENGMTASNLAQKWSNAVNTKTASTWELNPSDESLQQRATQDDIAISKMLCDADLSDPCYYSESESIDIKCPGTVHRLGRRPKIGKASIRTYVMQDMSYRLDEVVGMLLLRLQRFTDQHRILSGPDAQPEQVNKNRRFVIGLKEVSRRTRQSKIDCLIVAPDIEEDANTGGLDDRMRELLATAYQNQIPVIFALTRARLGQALGKSLHISVLGILDAKGAQPLLEESMLLADECRQTWLRRSGK